MSCVYFMQAGQQGPIKIGVALDVRKRMASLVSGCPDPLILLGQIPGRRTLEQRLHKVLRCSRRHQEWFNLTEDTAFLVEDALTLPIEKFLSRITLFETGIADHLAWLRANPVDATSLDDLYRECLGELRNSSPAEEVAATIGISVRALYAQAAGKNNPSASLVSRCIAAFPHAFSPLVSAMFSCVSTARVWPTYAALFPRGER